LVRRLITSLEAILEKNKNKWREKFINFKANFEEIVQLMVNDIYDDIIKAENNKNDSRFYLKPGSMLDHKGIFYQLIFTFL
jgi:hypothetical protein